MTSLMLHIVLYILLVSVGGFLGLWAAFAHQSQTTGPSVALDEHGLPHGIEDNQFRRSA